MKVYSGVPQELRRLGTVATQLVGRNPRGPLPLSRCRRMAHGCQWRDHIFHARGRTVPRRGRSSLRIPRGRGRWRPRSGPTGVEYRMFLPVAVPAFVNQLVPSELDVLRHNLQFPDYEDGRVEHGREFFEDALSDELVFAVWTAPSSASRTSSTVRSSIAHARRRARSAFSTRRQTACSSRPSST